ncbi:uL15 family ribosomal protein [Patescibacteria group bacterium]|nr:uL15 family ribosomal protein [Patescibacteria group bacterium]MBU1755120.1 uL15 family ribosomal protein [Patescibacteria group bacterium]
MQLNTLKPASKRVTSTRVGRGGTRGKTSGRGTKGQNARAGHKNRPEMRDLIKKIPKRRGYGQNRARTVRASVLEYVPVNLNTLEENFDAGATITPAVLHSKGIVAKRAGRLPAVKILGTGTLTKKLSISGCSSSVTAKAAVEAAGGSLL